MSNDEGRTISGEQSGIGDDEWPVPAAAGRVENGRIVMIAEQRRGSGDSIGAKRFESRSVDVRVSSAVAETMWHRAGQFSVAEGGRFERRPDAIIIHSRRTSPGLAGEPVGSWLIHWQSPTPDTATIYRLQWDSTAASERELWRAIDVLAGASPS
ncbi:MAG: hypothetical protein HY329_09745 [Chloroflexi bacterium]|nr:hypothetical protein [Chloroflexota bacterium]